MGGVWNIDTQTALKMKCERVQWCSTASGFEGRTGSRRRCAFCSCLGTFAFPERLRKHLGGFWKWEIQWAKREGTLRKGRTHSCVLKSTWSQILNPIHCNIFQAFVLCWKSFSQFGVRGQKWPAFSKLLVNLSFCFIITKCWIQSLCQRVVFLS